MSRMRMRSSRTNQANTSSSHRKATQNRTYQSVRTSSRRTNGIATLLKRLVLVLLLVVLIYIVLWVFRTLNPFYSFNPFIKDITIGESVLGSWHYGGIDAAGNLRFYHDTNGFQTVLIPPTLKRFAADGTFVIIVDHTPINLMIETSGKYMMQMFLQGFALVAVVGVVLVLLIQFLRLNRRRKPGVFSTTRRRQ